MQRDDHKTVPLLIPTNFNYDSVTNKIIKPKKPDGGYEEPTHTMRVVESSLRYISSIQGKIGVICIVGEARAGKSYLISKILDGTADSFELGPTMDAQTFGVWIGTKSLPGNDCSIILMDTEGIGHHAGSQSRDNALFAFSVLISSYLIYNSKGVPKAGDLDQMHYILNLCEMIQSADEYGADFKNFLPDFMWVLRDSFLQPTLMKNGAEVQVTALEYLLEQVLKREKVALRGGEASTDRNNKRERILTLFPSIDCGTLPMPDSNREKLQNLAQYENQLDNPDFLPAANRMAEYIGQKGSSPKRPWKEGETVTGPALASLVIELVDILNDPTKNIPIGTIWDNVSRNLWNKQLASSLEQYDTAMSILKQKFPMTIQDLIYAETSLSTSIQTEMSSKMGAGSYELCHEFLEKFKNETATYNAHNELQGGRFYIYKMENESASERFCKATLLSLFEPIKQKLDSLGPTSKTNYTMDKFLNEMEQMNITYQEKTGRILQNGDYEALPKQMEVLQSFTLKEKETYGKMIENLEGYNKSMMEQREQTQQAELKNKVAEEKLIQAQNEAKSQQAHFAAELKVMSERQEQSVANLRTELEARAREDQQRYENLIKTMSENFARDNREMMEAMRRDSNEQLARMEQNAQQNATQFAEAMRAMSERKPTIIVKRRCLLQ